MGISVKSILTPSTILKVTGSLVIVFHSFNSYPPNVSIFLTGFVFLVISYLNKSK